MNLDNTNGILTFYKDKTISIEQIAQAVFDAGFSVRFLKASINFSGAKISNNDCYELDNNFYQFIEVPDKTLEGSTTVSFIGKKFQPLSEARKWKNKMKKSCSSKNHYFITL